VPRLPTLRHARRMRGPNADEEGEAMHASAEPGHALTRRQALGGAAAAAGAAALVAPGAAVARGDDVGGDGKPPRRIAPPLTLTAARLFDPLTGEVTEGATVVFMRGLVRRAGRGVRPARGGRVIDLGGAFVLPGLLDAHVHASTVAAARLALSGGATTIRSASTSFYQDIGLRALGELGGLGVPRTLAAGVFVTPNLGDSILADPRFAPLATLPDGVRRPRDLRHVVRVNIARGVDLIKTRSTERAGLPEQDPRVQVYDERQIRAVVRAARRLRGGVACHGHGDEGIRDSVLAGVRSVEHGTFASQATLDLMRARGTYLVPTLSAVVDLAEPGGEYTDPRLVERGREMLRVLRETVPAAYERGIPIAAGTDTSYTPATLSSIAGEIRLLAQFGLANLDALRAATTTGAALVGRDGELGRLEPGYAADALVVGGDPLADLAALDDVRLVVAGGWIAREGDTVAEPVTTETETDEDGI
jgi:imidazolonepropionase-like amidohydrolase